MKFFDDAKLKAGVWLRERKEKAAEKKAVKMAEVHASGEHGHGRFWLLNVPATATILAAIVEVYWAFLFCIEATGRVDWNIQTASGSAEPYVIVWNFAFDSHLPVLIGLACATAPIVMISMVWLPVQFAMRGFGRWRRGTLIVVGLLANLLVIVSGTVVMNHNRQEQVRADLVVEQSAEANRAMLQANVTALQEELNTLMNHRSTYIATAASVGAAQYESAYVAQARATNDARLPVLERALGAARRADDLREQIRAARVEAATAAPAAAAAANVQDDVGAELNAFGQFVEVWRPPFVALICTLIGVFGSWWTLAMILGLNPRDVLRSGWAPENMRIEDKRHEAPIDERPIVPPREVVTDAETGEELVKVKPREYWRRRKGVPQKHEIQPDVPPDEKGVEHDGGARKGTPKSQPDSVELAAAFVAVPQHPENEVSINHPSEGAPNQRSNDQGGEELVDGQSDTPSQADIDAAIAELEQADEQPEPVQEQDAEADQREPETDPSRLIAAE